MVEGKLDFDPRIDLENLKKNLPKTDVLFRAVQLEKNTKGARLLIENGLAQKIIPNNMYTFDDYVRNVRNIPEGNISRNIVYNNDSQAYEYFWPLDYILEINELENNLKNNEYFVPKHAIPHLSETQKLFNKSKTLRSHL
ncbi:MAG: hypothetical protein KAT05_05585 [Spirochaetes bacterium]|nr:hypothetical protein [Spirochaetota bacterium]